MIEITSFLRYPGSKRRLLEFLSPFLPMRRHLVGSLVEPFVGGAAVFLHVQPRQAILSDLNPELIDLYRGIRRNPDGVWRIYRRYPNTKKTYREIRRLRSIQSLTRRAARSLYLNRTCFKGMWRHNQDGMFNIGYGGQSRRWAISRADLIRVASLLQRARLKCCDFERIIDDSGPGDFIFADPPYKPAMREMGTSHYVGQQFTFDDHIRLARALRRSSRRGVKWALTITSHPEVVALYSGSTLIPIEKGTSTRIGIRTMNSGEVLILGK